MKLELIISFVTGALTGAGVAYVFTKKAERKRFDMAIEDYKYYCDERINSLEAQVKKLKEASKKDDEACGDVPEKGSEEQEKSIEELSKNVDRAVEHYNKVKKNLEWQGHMTVDEAMETGDPQLIEQAEWQARRKEMIEKNHFKGQDGSPQVIDQLEYTGEGEGEYTHESSYDCISLDWFAKDGILTYGHPCEVDGETFDLHEIVEKPGFVVGWEWKKHFGDKELHNDDDCVYVKNELLECYFEIVRDPGSYKEIVLGLDYDEEEGSGEEE